MRNEKFLCVNVQCFTFLLFVVSIFAPNTAAQKIKVHLIPHTHDDVGWLKTVDQYAVGLNNTIQQACTNCILDSVMESLKQNPKRTFTYVEQGFFQRWWREQSQSRQAEVKLLVKNGQLQFVNGGWCMHDEAAAHYLDMIDQTTYGHSFLKQQFGVTPTIGWQLDPFGHSATQAALLSAEVGFNGLFFGRIDYQDLAHRIEKKEAEFIWRASPSLGPSAQVFTGLTGEYKGNYGPPEGFCWDISCKDDPIQDDHRLEGYNVEDVVERFWNQANWLAKHTQGHNVMMTMGSDFQYEVAGNWFRNMDKLIKFMDEDGRMDVFYSTPETYVAAKLAENISWPLKTDDFFPYASNPNTFWTGYLTSRPALKRYIRYCSAVLQVVRQVSALVFPKQDPAPELETFVEALAVVQHHDGVSGTSKQHVAFDYAQRLSKGLALAEVVVSKALSNLLGQQGATVSMCPLLNASLCPPMSRVSHGGGVTIIAWNALAHARHAVVRLPVKSCVASVKDILTGNDVPFQCDHSSASYTNYRKIEPSAHPLPNIISLFADVPGMSFAAYKLTYRSLPANQNQNYHQAQQNHSSQKDDNTSTPAGLLSSERLVGREIRGNITIRSPFTNLTFCGDTGLLCEMSHWVGNPGEIKTTAIRQEMLYYKPHGDGVTSGVYIFRPEGGARPLTELEGALKGSPSTTVAKITEVIHGPFISEVRQEFTPWASQIIRLKNSASSFGSIFEVDYVVGPLPQTKEGVEIISKFTIPEIKNEGVCYTDSNGREMQKRTRDFRPTWDFMQTEPVAGNYYPVTTAQYIADEHLQLTMLTDTAQGGSGCIEDGSMEMMLHRRLVRDDHFGMGEALNETEFAHPYWAEPWAGDSEKKKFGKSEGRGLIIRGSHQIVLNTPDRAASIWRPLMDEIYHPWHLFFANTTNVTLKAMSPLGYIPASVQIVTLDVMSPGQILCRIAHRYALHEDFIDSRIVKVNFREAFPIYNIVKIMEMSLTANQLQKDMLSKRYKWKADKEEEEAQPHAWRSNPPLHWTKGGVGVDPFTFIGPMEIKTFILHVK